MISSIIRNLLSNSIKFTPKNGKIQISCKAIKLDNNKDGIEISIKDNGVGISAEKLDKIFKIGECDSTAGTENEKGTGLGLILCKEFVEKHGGKIWAESRLNQGSDFKFILPMVSEINKLSEKPHKTIKKEFNILIVEDEDVNHIFLKLLLKQSKLNLKTLHAKNGLEAVEICRNNPDIDLVLMDIRMPVMDGNEAIREIRKFNKNLIIIVQSAFVQTKDKEKAFLSGCNDFISKPLDGNKLLKILNKYLVEK